MCIIYTPKFIMSLILYSAGSQTFDNSSYMHKLFLLHHFWLNIIFDPKHLKNYNFDQITKQLNLTSRYLKKNPAVSDEGKNCTSDIFFNYSRELNFSDIIKTKGYMIICHLNNILFQHTCEIVPCLTSIEETVVQCSGKLQRSL